MINCIIIVPIACSPIGQQSLLSPLKLVQAGFLSLATKKITLNSPPLSFKLAMKSFHSATPKCDYFRLLELSGRNRFYFLFLVSTCSYGGIDTLGSSRITQPPCPNLVPLLHTSPNVSIADRVHQQALGPSLEKKGRPG